MALIEENKRTQKGNKVSRIFGIVVVCIALCFMLITNTGMQFPLNNFVDLISLLTIILIEIGVILVSKARTKEKVLQLLSKTILPVGLLNSIVSTIIVLIYVSNGGIKSLGANLAVVLLGLLYSVIIKIAVEILLIND